MHNSVYTFITETVLLVWKILSVQSLKFPQDSFAAHPKDIRNKWEAAQGVPRCSYTKQPLTGTLPPPDIPQAETRLSPLLLPHSLLTCPYPILSSHSNTIVPFFSVIPISPITNESRIFFSILLFLHPPPFSQFPCLLLSLFFPPSLGADERQALSRQWHSKTSGLGSSVSGYSTLLGAISLSKAWPAYSPTKNHQISYYTLHMEGRHTASFCATSGFLHADQMKRWANIRNGKIIYESEMENKRESVSVLAWESGCMCA